MLYSTLLCKNWGVNDESQPEVFKKNGLKKIFLFQFYAVNESTESSELVASRNVSGTSCEFQLSLCTFEVTGLSPETDYVAVVKLSLLGDTIPVQYTADARTGNKQGN